MMLTPEKQAKVETLLTQAILGRLATSRNNQPHVIPVWFLWEEGAAWISAYDSTRKVHELLYNPKCALVIDVQDSEGGIAAVLMEGNAELVREPRDEVKARIERVYTKYLGAEGVLARDPQDWLNSPENLLIKLIPEKMFVW
jgi:nitroimidazol reductase NimA-like FMN-containing flavoprotein (pyridoxamine 5'-phosphate oxidase superfamily)